MSQRPNSWYSTHTRHPGRGGGRQRPAWGHRCLAWPFSAQCKTGDLNRAEAPASPKTRPGPKYALKQNKAHMMHGWGRRDAPVPSRTLETMPAPPLGQRTWAPPRALRRPRTPPHTLDTCKHDKHAEHSQEQQPGEIQLTRTRSGWPDLPSLRRWPASRITNMSPVLPTTRTLGGGRAAAVSGTAGSMGERGVW